MSTEVQNFSNGAVLYVGDIDRAVNESDILNLFSKYGEVQDVKLIKKNNDPFFTEKKPYAYVIFKNKAESDQALRALNYTKLGASEMRIMNYEPGKNHRKKGANVWVKNLPDFCDNKMLYDSFSIIGTITSCKVAKDSSGKNKGYGFVQFSTKTEAKKAIFIGKDVRMNGQFLTVEKYEPRDLASKIFPKNLYFKEIDVKKVAQYEERLRSFGDVISVSFTAKDGECTGTGFISYEDPDVAERVCKELNGKMLFGWNKEFYICPALPKTKRKEEVLKKFSELKASPSTFKRNLYVTNIPKETAEREIRAFFSEYGTVESICLGESRNAFEDTLYGFVLFSTPAEATLALEKANKKLFKEHELNVSFFKSKKEREFESSLSVISDYYKNIYKKDSQKSQSSIKKTESDIFNSLKSLSNLLKSDWESAGLVDENEFAKVVTKEIMKKSPNEINEMISVGDTLISNAKQVLLEISQEKKNN